MCCILIHERKENNNSLFTNNLVYLINITKYKYLSYYIKLLINHLNR